jgi:hypothetical protein
MGSTVSLAYIQQCLTRYGMTTYLIFGNVGLLCNIAFFSRRAYRQTSASLYILVMSLCAFIGLNISVIPIIYGLDHTDPLTIFSAFCQLQRYFRHTFNQIMRTFVVLTCADHCAATSQYARIRSFSQFKVAIRVIPFVFIFWFVIGFFPTMLGSLLSGTCSTSTGLYAILNPAYFSVVVGIIPLLCMITLAVLLYKNFRKLRTRVQPVTQLNSVITNMNIPTKQLLHKRDRDMLRMLLIEITCHIMTTIPITIMLIYSSITRTATKSSDQRLIESFVSYVTNSFVYYMNNCFSFWVYISASRTFRLEFKNLIIKVCVFFTCK